MTVICAHNQYHKDNTSGSKGTKYPYFPMTCHTKVNIYAFILVHLVIIRFGQEAQGIREGWGGEEDDDV